jgi:hypothetical protein
MRVELSDDELFECMTTSWWDSYPSRPTYCGHSEYTETGLKFVYCKYCGKKGHLEMGKVTWENEDGK